MKKEKKLVIIGDSVFAHIAYEYFTHDSPYEVGGFCVERNYIKQNELFGIPVVPFEEIEAHFPPDEYSFFVAIVYTQLNRLRTRFYNEAKSKGYTAASYISPHAFVWRNCKIGDHCFIFENNVVQPFVEIGDNVVLWSGNHIGHHSRIGDNCFISSHVVISGHVTIGDNCFFGVNATVINNITIAADCLVGAATLITKDIDEDKVVRGSVSEIANNAKRLCKVKDELCGVSKA